MSQERTQKNFLAKSAVFSKDSLLLIFMGAISAPFLLVGGFTMFFGVAGCILLLGAFSRLHVEYAYAMILKWRDKSYWEEYVPNVLTPDEKKRIKRIVLTIGEILAMALIGLFIKPEKVTNIWVARLVLLFIVVVLIDWLWCLVLFLRKKMTR